MEDKKADLKIYHDLVIATIDYYINTPSLHFKTNDFDTKSHFENLRLIATDDYKKGRLTKLKRWFRDLTEMQVETKDFKFIEYLRETTGYDINIHQDFYKRVDKIVEKGKITTDNQFREINTFVDMLCQSKPVNYEKIEVLNKLLLDYENNVK
jgi:hypothetical protein